MIQKLLSYGNKCRYEVTDIESKTPLDLAVLFKNDEAAKLLKDHDKKLKKALLARKKAVEEKKAKDEQATAKEKIASVVEHGVKKQLQNAAAKNENKS